MSISKIQSAFRRSLWIGCSLFAMQSIATLVAPSHAAAQPPATSDIVANDSPPSELRIATWNLEWFFDNYQGDNQSDLSKELSAPSEAAWKWKISVVADAVAKLNPTILAVQEIENRRVLMDLTSELKEKHNLSFRVAYVEGFDSATEQDVGILYRGGLVEFSRFEQSKPMFDSKQYYNLSKHLMARFTWGDGDQEEQLAILNLHLRAKAEETELRQKQAKLARHFVRKELNDKSNVIILGDLNTEEVAGQVAPTSDMGILMGLTTPSTDDDMIDLLDKGVADKRRTHLLLDKQFDRLVATPSLLADDPAKKDLVFRSIEVRTDVVIRGTGIDANPDHWEQYWKLPDDQRDISDHYPVIATFDFK